MSDTVSVGTGHSQRDCPAGPLASGTVPRIWVDVCVCVCVWVCVWVCVYVYARISASTRSILTGQVSFSLFFFV